LTFGDFDE
nr:Chain B, Non-structural protein 3 [Semliki Forest virus]